MSDAPAKTKSRTSRGTDKPPGGSSQRGRKRKTATQQMHENEMIIAPPAADMARPELPTVHHPHPQSFGAHRAHAQQQPAPPAHAPGAHHYSRPQGMSTSHVHDRDYGQPARPSMPDPQRSMLQQAWHVALSSDPLVDSDEENPDGHVRLEYTRRLSVISRLRGRPPTPSPELENAMLAPAQSLH